MLCGHKPRKKNECACVLQKGVNWAKKRSTNTWTQRESDIWFTRQIHKLTKCYSIRKFELQNLLLFAYKRAKKKWRKKCSVIYVYAMLPWWSPVMLYSHFLSSPFGMCNSFIDNVSLILFVSVFNCRLIIWKTEHQKMKWEKLWKNIWRFFSLLFLLFGWLFICCCYLLLLLLFRFFCGICHANLSRLPFHICC